MFRRFGRQPAAASACHYATPAFRAPPKMPAADSRASFAERHIAFICRALFSARELATEALRPAAAPFCR